MLSDRVRSFKIQFNSRVPSSRPSRRRGFCTPNSRSCNQCAVDIIIGTIIYIRFQSSVVVREKLSTHIVKYIMCMCVLYVCIWGRRRRSPRKRWHLQVGVWGIPTATADTYIYYTKVAPPNGTTKPIQYIYNIICTPFCDTPICACNTF